MTVFRDKRFLFSLLFILAVAAAFWTGSRYPELSAKATMGAVSDLQTLGLEVKWEIYPADGRFTRILKSTGNWIDANKRGMIFGLIFAAGLMTALSTMPRRALKGRFANTLAGMVIGSPLGVCVNCATPVARGMHAGGTRLETSLALMFSSPTLNIIVLTMLFTLLPWHIALVKIVFTLIPIIVGVPLAGKYWGDKVKGGEVPDPFCETLEIDTSDGWWTSFTWFVSELARKFCWICIRTVPFMILAGLLGAILNEFLPMEQFISNLSAQSFMSALLILILLCLAGTFIPVPMAMDVILAASLYAMGTPVYYVVAILCTTGTYSILSFLVIYRQMSKSLALTLFGAVAVIGFVAGVLSHYVDKANNRWLEHHFLTFLRQSPATLAIDAPIGPEPKLFSELQSQIQKQNLVFERSSDLEIKGVEVERVALNKDASENPSSRIFATHSGSEIGISIPFSVSTEHRASIWQMQSRTIGSGDIHGDGWPDVVVANDTRIGGATLFANLGGRKFEPQQLPLGELSSEPIGLTALVDIDNDGSLDLFLSSFRKGSFWLKNIDGDFSSSELRRLTKHEYSTVASAGFGDLNHDGQLDLVLGNWTIGGINIVTREGAPPSSRNEILFSGKDGAFISQKLPGEPGETLGILLSDINNDGRSDLLIGNDFDEPDFIYLANEELTFDPVKRTDKLIPFTPFFNMGFASGDLDNDLSPEILGIGIATGGLNRSREVGLTREEFALELEDPDLKERHLKYHEQSLLYEHDINPMIALRWNSVEDQRLKQDILGNHVLRRMRMDPGLYDWASFIPEHREDFQWIAERIQLPLEKVPFSEVFTELPQIHNRNVLFSRTNGTAEPFTDVSKKWALTHTGWSWNAKFADLDLDGWQDLYLVNGWPLSPNHEPNLLLRNREGETFEDVTEANDVGSYLETIAYSYLDLDLDGDLDILSVPLMGPIQWHENLSAADNKAVVVELRDEIGNPFGIGSKVIIKSDAGQQMREIKASGGFASYDPLRAHFGLGKSESVNSIEIRWADGETTLLEKPIPSGYRYRIHRKRSGD